jgi:hypothetical protein
MPEPTVCKSFDQTFAMQVANLPAKRTRSPTVRAIDSARQATKRKSNNMEEHPGSKRPKSVEEAADETIQYLTSLFNDFDNCDDEELISAIERSIDISMFAKELREMSVTPEISIDGLNVLVPLSGEEVAEFLSAMTC